MDIKPSVFRITFHLVITTLLICRDDSLKSSDFPEITEECINQFPKDCGLPSIQPSLLSRFRIVGGAYAVPNSWPWQLSLQVNTYTGGWKHNCGASILSSCYAITAAHCVNDYVIEPTSIRVVAGLHDRTKDAGQTHTVQKIIVHPDYVGRDTQWDSDLALVKVYPPFQFSKGVSTICLGAVSPSQGEMGVATGWGYSKNGGSLNTTLNQVELPLITHDRCQQYYPEVTSFKTRFCAGFPKTGGKDTCQGDSGGPFVMKDDQQFFVLSGVTSVGASCAEVNKPGIYTDLALFKNWIMEQIQVLDCGVLDNAVMPTKSPWLLRLLYYGNTKDECTGVLVADNWVLTASRCVNKIVPKSSQSKSIRVISPTSTREQNVSRIFCHPTMNACLLKLKTRVAWQPVCLPTRSPTAGDKCVLTQWKKTSNTVLIQPCKSKSNYICSESTTAESCTGDISAPLTCAQTQGRHFLFGLVQEVCGEEGGAWQHMDVLGGVEWVNSIVAEN